MHVHRDRAELEASDHGLDVLGAVAELEADGVTGRDAAGAERVRALVRAPLELREGASLLAAHQRRPIRDRVGDELEEIRRGWNPNVAPAQGFSLPTIHIEKNCEPPP